MRDDRVGDDRVEHLGSSRRDDSVLVLGLAKTGTSALYAALKKAHDFRCVYEVSNAAQVDYLRRQSATRPVLAKALLPRVPPIAQGLASTFGRRVMIVRDPRDVVVSWLLYRPLLHGNHENADFVADYVAVLREKERAPRSVSLSRLDEVFDVHGLDRRHLDAYEQWFAVEEEVARAFGDLTVIRYEDYVDGRTRTVEDALGIRPRTDATLGAHHSLIARSKGHGAWRHWFTDADVERYRTVFDPYLARHGYPTSWDLADTPSIDPATSSEHVRRHVEGLRRLPPSTGELRDRTDYTPERVRMLQAAAEDGRERHMVELALAYRDGYGVRRDVRHAVELMADVADRGNFWALVHLGLAHRHGAGGLRPDPQRGRELFAKAGAMSSQARALEAKAELSPGWAFASRGAVSRLGSRAKGRLRQARILR